MKVALNRSAESAAGPHLLPFLFFLFLALLPAAGLGALAILPLLLLLLLLLLLFVLLLAPRLLRHALGVAVAPFGHHAFELAPNALDRVPL